MTSKPFDHRDITGYVVVVVLSVIIAFLVHTKSEADTRAAVENYRQLSQKETEAVSGRIQEALKLVYQGIRTISFLPSVRSIDRHGKNLDENAHAAIQQIYKNMVSNVDVSEIYIVPGDIDPEKIDPVTKELEVPILMYDGTDPKAEEENKDKKLINTLELAEHADQVEIYEYRLLREQMAYFQQNYGDKSKIDGLNPPIIAGHEVLTCDNKEFDATKKDADRTGIVLSVPLYNTDGKFKGGIAAIIRNNVLRKLLPDTRYVLTNKDYNETIYPENFDPSLETSPDHLFATNVPIETTDPRSHWQLVATYPDSDFTDSAAAKSIRNFKIFGYTLSVLVTIIGGAIWMLLRRNVKSIEKNNAELEQKINQRTAEIESLAKEQEGQRQRSEQEKKAAMRKFADEFERSVGSVVTNVSEGAADMRIAAGTLKKVTEDVGHKASIVTTTSQQTSGNVQTVASAAEELSASIQEISRNVMESSTVSRQAVDEAAKTNSIMTRLAETAGKIGVVLELINDIAGQTNLLALNATIEAARAGEAGKGFAVVASEVKNLASQTAKATEEIKGQIEEMQTATTTAVDAIDGISKTIMQLNNISTQVNTAVEQQATATQEIARNVQQASRGTNEVTANIENVSTATQTAGTAATKMMSASDDLAKQAEKLHDEVNNFLTKVRGS